MYIDLCNSVDELGSIGDNRQDRTRCVEFLTKVGGEKFNGVVVNLINRDEWREGAFSPEDGSTNR